MLFFLTQTHSWARLLSDVWCLVSVGLSAVENIMGRENEVDHLAIPAACFTHPEIAMVGLTEEQAKEKVTVT